jgi:hypothetical protein
MNFKYLKNSLLVLSCLFLVNSCSTGADPEDVILEDYKIPAQLALQIQNIINDMAMQVNGIAMNNIETVETKKITKDVPECLNANIYAKADGSAVDSLVLDYGSSSSCSSNGASFRGKMIVEPTATANQYKITLKSFISSSYEINGDFQLQVTGDKHGEDFTWSTTGASFVATNSDDVKFTYSITSLSSEYTFLKSQDGDKDYVDDVFSFIINLDGTMNSGATFSFESTTGLTYAYKCKDILGGNATFSLEGFADGTYNFGGGDPNEDCDKKVIFSADGATIEMTL